jgi:hypothetical protein
VHDGSEKRRSVADAAHAAGAVLRGVVVESSLDIQRPYAWTRWALPDQTPRTSPPVFISEAPEVVLDLADDLSVLVRGSRMRVCTHRPRVKTVTPVMTVRQAVRRLVDIRRRGFEGRRRIGHPASKTTDKTSVNPVAPFRRFCRGGSPCRGVGRDAMSTRVHGSVADGGLPWPARRISLTAPWALALGREPLAIRASTGRVQGRRALRPHPLAGAAQGAARQSSSRALTLHAIGAFMREAQPGTGRDDSMFRRAVTANLVSASRSWGNFRVYATTRAPTRRGRYGLIHTAQSINRTCFCGSIFTWY